MRRFFAVAGVLLAGVVPSRAQPSYLRSADLRTPTTQSVMGARKLWGVDAAFGGSRHRGNVDLALMNTSLQTFVSRGPSTAYLAGRAVYHTQGGRRVQNQGRLALRYEHALGGPWRLFAFNTTGYNEFIRLDLRNKTGAGPWYDLSLGPTKHGLSAGVAHVYEEFKGGLIERTQRSVLRWVGTLPVSDLARFETDVYYSPALGDWRDYHFDAELAFQTLFWKDVLGLRVSWTDEYDSKPKKGVRRSDTLWTTSVTARFGR